MYPILFSCPYFTVYSFGLCLFVGYVLYTRLLERDPVITAHFNKNQLHALIFGGMLAAIIFSRVFYFLGSPEGFDSFFEVINVADQQGGFSVLGALLGICIYAFFIYKNYNFPFKKVVDRCALYAPFLHACGRIGCFLAGCCYGLSSYPIQLHSAVMLALIGLILMRMHKKLEKVPGRLTCFYLIALAAERFTVDFWRGDRVLFSQDSVLSFDQYGALVLISVSVSVALFLEYVDRHAS